MSIPMNSPVIVGIDGSSSSHAALQWAAEEALLHHRPLKLVHTLVPPVIGTFPETPMPLGYTRWQRDQGEQYLQQSVEWLQSHSHYAHLEIHTTILAGPTVGLMLELSHDAYMLVVGCRGQGALKRALLGSVSSALVHHAQCPVSVVRDVPPPATDAPIVVGVDGSSFSQTVLQFAFEEASLRHVDLIAVYAWYDGEIAGFSGVDPAVFDTEGHALLAEQLAGFQEMYPDVTVHRVVMCDRPADQLVKQSQQGQLIILGSHGRGGFPGMLLGSVGAAVVHSNTIPTVILRQPAQNHKHHHGHHHKHNQHGSTITFADNLSDEHGHEHHHRHHH